MAKRTTKAEIILRNMRKRVETVEKTFQEHTTAAGQALETLTLLRQVYADLERSLAPKPRGKTATPSATKKSTRKDAEPLLKEAGKEPICGICGNEEGFTDHFPPSPNYHAFESGEKKASAA